MTSINGGKLRYWWGQIPKLWAQMKDVLVRLLLLEFASVVKVSKASDFGIIDSTKVYRIDGIIDMGTTSIEIPVGGINILGATFDVSKLVSSEDNFTLFTSPVGGSGGLLMTDIAIEITGANSSVYGLTDATGFNAVEYYRVNFNDCTSLGYLENYRQGLESGTGRFGGSPSLTLNGTWVGGFRITTSIVRGLDAGMTEPLFKAGVGFNMASRFLTDINCDLPPLAALIDFSPTNFINSNTLQLSGCIITRSGITDPTDTNISPNISHVDIESVWRDNSGVENTFIGGCIGITTEVQTTVSTPGVFYDLEGTWSAMDLQHFDHSVNGQLKHLGSGARNYNVFLDVSLDGGANDELDLKIVVWDSSASTFIDYKTNRRVVNNFQGGRDIAFFTYMASIILDKGDYVKLQTANSTDTTNITGELGSEIRIEER